MELDDSREFGFCRYCGAQIAIEKVVIEHRGTVNVDGVADTNALLDRAQMHLEANKYKEALQCCERSLDINPRNSEAYICKLMAETHTNSRSMLGNSVKPLEKYDSYKKAIRFASPEVQKELSEYNQQSIVLFSSETDRRKRMVEQKEDELSLQEKKLDEGRNAAKGTHLWISMHQFFVAIAIVLGVITIRWGGFLLPIVGGLVLRLLRKRAENNEKYAYYQSQTVREAENVVEQSKKDFEDWLKEMNSDC